MSLSINHVGSNKLSDKYTKKHIDKREKFCRKLVETQIMIIGLWTTGSYWIALHVVDSVVESLLFL